MLDFEKLWLECKDNFGIQQKKEEYQTFLNLLIEHNVKNILEIGCYSGGTTRGFLEIADSVISIDGTKQPQIYSLERQFPDKYKFLDMNSHMGSTPEYLRQNVSHEFDLLFIDGDHSAFGAEQDFLMYKDFVKKGGIIAFHDIVDSEHHHSQGCYVDVTWNKLKTNLKNQEIILVDNVWAGIGVLFV